MDAPQRNRAENVAVLVFVTGVVQFFLAAAAMSTPAPPWLGFGVLGLATLLPIVAGPYAVHLAWHDATGSRPPLILTILCTAAWLLVSTLVVIGFLYSW